MIELMTEDDVSKFFKVEKSTIRTWINRNKFPDEVIFRLPGAKSGTRRFIKAKLEAWVSGTL